MDPSPGNGEWGYLAKFIVNHLNYISIDVGVNVRDLQVVNMP
jgi:hypothetical protein